MSSSVAGGAPASPVEQDAASEVAANGAGLTASDARASAGEQDGHGELNAQRDAPVGGQAVLEGVMMRGVGHWSVAVRKPTAAQLQDDDYSPAQGAEGEIAVSTFPLVTALQRHRWLRMPIIRGVVALGGSLVVGFRALEISANAQLPDEPPAQGFGERGEQRRAGRRAGAPGDPGRRVGRHGRRIARARGRPVLRRPGRAHEPHQGPARILGAVLGRRGHRAHRHLPRLPARALADPQSATRVRVPRRRAQDDLLL